MTLHVKFFSAFIRKADIATHYPGGCTAFEKQHNVNESDTHLYRLLAMSGADLEFAIDSVRHCGFDCERYVAVADMCLGPLDTIASIIFTNTAEGFPPLWLARAAEEHNHV